MSAQCEVAGKRAAGSPMGLFERYLTLWVFLCIGAGIFLGHLFPDLFRSVGRLEFASVNLPVAALIWLMIIPMLLKVDFGALHHLREHWRGIAVTLFVNWLVKPFSMALLGWLFIRHGNDYADDGPQMERGIRMDQRVTGKLGRTIRANRK